MRSEGLSLPQGSDARCNKRGQRSGVFQYLRRDFSVSKVNHQRDQFSTVRSAGATGGGPSSLFPRLFYSTAGAISSLADALGAAWRIDAPDLPVNFRPGSFVAGAAFLLAGMASAESVDVSHSTLTLQGTEEPGAVAELVFDNNATNSAGDNGIYTLTHEGLSVAVQFEWNAGGTADRITVEAPEGYIASPRSLDVQEHRVERIFIYPMQLELM